MNVAATRGRAILLQSVVTTGTGVPIAIPPSFYHHTVYITGSAGVSAGAIQLETSDDPLFAGTWAPINAPVTVVVSGKAVIVFEGIYMFLRARVSTNVVGGTATVNYIGG